MTTPAELLTAIAGKLRAARTSADAPVFNDVRAQLALYELKTLIQQSSKTPAARVCLLKGVPVPRSDGGIDLDASIAIVVVVDRRSLGLRASPESSGVDLALSNLMIDVARAILADPYVGRTDVSAAEFGDQIVASSDEQNNEGLAIGLCEVKWRLHEVVQARPVIQGALETGRFPHLVDAVQLNDDPPLEPWPPTPPGGGAP